MQPSSYLCVHCIYGGHQALQSSKNPATSCHICVQCVNSVQHLSGGPTDRLGQLALCPLCGHDSCSQGHSPKGPNAAGCTQVLATTKNVHFTATGDHQPLTSCNTSQIKAGTTLKSIGDSLSNPSESFERLVKDLSRTL